MKRILSLAVGVCAGGLVGLDTRSARATQRTTGACRVLVIPFFAAIAVVAAAQSPTSERARTEALSRRVDERVRALQLEADRLAGQSRTLIGELRKLEIERDLQAERVKQAERDVATADAALQETSQKLAALQQQRVEQLPDLSAQLVELYKQRKGGQLRVLLGVRDFRAFGRATRAISSLVEMNEQRITAHRRTLDAVRQEQGILEQQTREVRRHQAEAQQARSAAERAVRARASLIAQIDRRRDLNAQLLGELQLAQEQLSQAVNALRAGRVPESVTVPVAPFRGTLDWPVIGRVLSRFGQSLRPGGSPRNGIEIAAPETTPVHAVHAGTVSYADTFSGYGTLVILDHGSNHYSLYGYLSAASVQRGERVDGGQELGRVGTAPTGPPALYFEIRVDDRSVDPLQWLKPR